MQRFTGWRFQLLIKRFHWTLVYKELQSQRPKIPECSHQSQLWPVICQSKAPLQRFRERCQEILMQTKINLHNPKNSLKAQVDLISMRMVHSVSNLRTVNTQQSLSSCPTCAWILKSTHSKSSLRWLSQSRTFPGVISTFSRISSLTSSENQSLCPVQDSSTLLLPSSWPSEKSIASCPSQSTFSAAQHKRCH